MISSMQIWWSGANKLWPVYQLWQTHYKLRTSQFTVKYINDSVWPVINNISRGWWRLVSSINTLQNLKDIQYVLQVWLKTSSRPLNWDTAMTAKTKLRTHCNAAMFAPSRWGGSAAATSALGNTRFDKYYIGLELRCPQPLQGLEGVEDLHTTEQTGVKNLTWEERVNSDASDSPRSEQIWCGCLPSSSQQTAAACRIWNSWHVVIVHCDTFGCTLNKTCSEIVTWPLPQAARPLHTSYSWPAQSG